MAGLSAGSYVVEFRDAFSGGRYLPEYWDDAREARDAAQIPVASAATVTGINARLAVAGAIEGTVTDATGTPLVGAYVYAVSREGPSGTATPTRTEPATTASADSRRRRTRCRSRGTTW